jgi:hypothetical protein
MEVAAKCDWIAVVLAVLVPLAPAPAVGQTSVSFGDPKTPNVLTPGVPFQGERVTKTTMRLQGGSLLVREEHELLGRDADGRFFDESFQPAVSGKTDHHFIVADPIAKRELSWMQGATTASANPLQPSTRLNVTALPLDRRTETALFPKDETTVTTDDLGSKIIGGVMCTGTRTVTTLAAGAIGNAEPLQRSEEVWTANDLQIVVAETDISPMLGTRTVTMVSLERTAPSAGRFNLPKGLAIKDSPLAGLPGFPGLIPVPGVPATLPVHKTESPDYWQALDDIVKPELREDAAAKLIAYAHTHDEVANHVAIVLAVRNTHLDDAVALGRASLDRSEQASASIELDQVLAGDTARMSELAEYWNTWGWIRWVQGDEETAKRFTRAAWGLGGEGLYMDHLARMAMKDGDTDATRHMLHVAFSGVIDEREKNQIINDLAKLGADKPEAIEEPIVVTLPDHLPMEGSAEFWLLFAGDTKPQVKWVRGDDKLALLLPAITAAEYPPQTPDDGPEHVLRRARVDCHATDCKLTLLYSEQLQRTPAVSPIPLPK